MPAPPCPRPYEKTTVMAQAYSNDRRRPATRPPNDLTRHARLANDLPRLTIPSPSPSLSRTRAQTETHARSFSTSSASTLVDANNTSTHGASGSRPSMHRPSSSMDSSGTCIAKPALLVVKETRRTYSVDDKAAPLVYATVEPPPYSRADVGPEPRTLPMERRGTLDPFVMAGLPAVEKTAAEKEIERMKRRWEVETKWAKRCMWATVLFVCLGLAAGMSTWGAIIARRSKV
ncbi:hypothetical protein C0991_009302 [Blastosporella zonata]|nr:hypothetical protein C0991_009302 [Blastosporella zonata]